jgi:hypothetical protein
MARRIFTSQGWTPTAQADTTALTNATYMGIKGGSSTQLIYIREFRISGLATASAPSYLNFARASTIETTPTALSAATNATSDGPAHPSTSALSTPPVVYVAAATGPQRSAVTTDPKINLGFNTFGGVVRYELGPDTSYALIGHTVALFGVAMLSAFTGGSGSPVISADIVYEPQ